MLRLLQKLEARMKHLYHLAYILNLITKCHSFENMKMSCHVSE